MRASVLLHGVARHHIVQGHMPCAFQKVSDNTAEPAIGNTFFWLNSHGTQSNETQGPPFYQG